MSEALRYEKTNCIYEDQEIKVFYYQGSSDYLLVTFGDLVTLVDGERFSADVPVKKLGITCIGFMAKTGNWYPKSSMQKAAQITGKIFKKYQTIIGYGGSMGGYASIKFSKLLGLTHSIAFCPQWSIDKNECGVNNPGYQSYYNDSMSGMGIKKDEVIGDVVVIYDPAHDRDSFHARKIAEMYPDTVLQKFRSSDHHVTLILAGSRNLELMLRLVSRGDYQGFQQQSSYIRRSHPRRAKILLLKSAKKHPKFIKHIFTRKDLVDRFENSDLIEAVGLSLNISLSKKDVRLSSDLIQILLGLDIDSQRKSILAELLMELLQKNEIPWGERIITAHGTQLYYSASCSSLVHLRPEQCRSWHAPAMLSKKSGTYRLIVERGGLSWFLSTSRSGSVTLVDSSKIDTHPEPIIHAVMADGFFTLMRADKYMSCEPRGVVMYNRSEAKAWEKFRWNERG